MKTNEKFVLRTIVPFAFLVTNKMKILSMKKEANGLMVKNTFNQNRIKEIITKTVQKLFLISRKYQPIFDSLPVTKGLLRKQNCFSFTRAIFFVNKITCQPNYVLKEKIRSVSRKMEKHKGKVCFLLLQVLQIKICFIQNLDAT